jgi:Spy/CpxP family protein refolding chaperone
MALTASVAVAIAPLGIALLPGNAYADCSCDSAGAKAPTSGSDSMLEHGGGLAKQALDLGSLTGEQRATIQVLAADRRTAAEPAREANRKLLTQMADQLDNEGSIDEDKLAPTASAVDQAVSAAMPGQADAANHLHALLTREQRNMLIDHVEAKMSLRAALPQTRAPEGSAGMPEVVPERGGMTRLGLTPEQRSTITTRMIAARNSESGPPAAEQAKAFLEGFRKDKFDARTFGRPPSVGRHERMFAEVVVPVLTPVQRTTFAEILRERAAQA